MNILSRALRRPKTPPPKGKKRINLALQGGGAHGAFTWGVLDELLQDGRIEIEGISGTSAGAINAVMVADGLARGGPEEARKRLADFWRAASLGGDAGETDLPEERPGRGGGVLVSSDDSDAVARDLSGTLPVTRDRGLPVEGDEQLARWRD